ncbi:mannose-1-phosphate guanylyltransferase [Robinsoniella peoriensis]|uniref:mannose-1-phosphate guanylyltransferase n=1 Tax=Robinsoniella peoriensis TaxID=180332 RepID=A0A4U8Q2P5_9FIRM|nr:sugar phosphate nucleotidyltransferase [Robinsoniella peoriensis]MDU7026104.1 sugar phosphate nucleotidyltransferase [Clostridiales bacterium]TLC98906.1 Alginate biosynthesis protein AlgA [Robinsoniella peoriensis]
MNIYGIIMAGGGGARFWPASRQKTPKQLLNLTGKDLMINETIYRVCKVVDQKNIFIVTNSVQYDNMIEVTPDFIKKDRILSEPSAKNTAACIGYAAVEIIKKYGDGVMCIFPSDHYIKDEECLINILQEAINVAMTSEKLVTIGITPTFPSTGYGYIKYNNSDEMIKNVLQFVEKPNLNTAQRYYESGEYAWNSGMFIWKASTILNNFKLYLPEVYKCLEQISEIIGTDEEESGVGSIYERIPSISIDYGILEKSKDVVVLTGDFGWNDVGSWETMDTLYKADSNDNIIRGEQINIQTKNCISISQGRLIATIGVQDLIIVETDDAILVCSKSKAQNVKDIVEVLKEKGDSRYL